MKTTLTDRLSKTPVKYARIAVALLLLLCGLIFLYRYDPSVSGFYPPCIFKKFTGLNCAGCGSARACHDLVHGNLAKAADHNILLLGFLPLTCVWLTVRLTGRGLRLWQKLNKPLPVLIIICLFWILRNIDAYPFTWLNADK